MSAKPSPEDFIPVLRNEMERIDQMDDPNAAALANFKLVALSMAQAALSSVRMLEALRGADVISRDEAKRLAVKMQPVLSSLRELVEEL